MSAKPRTPKAPKAPVSLPLPIMDERWWENSLTRRLLPGNVETILVGGLNGDLTEQLALFNLMADTWPHLQNNLRTLRDAVASAPWQVSPWSDDDGTPITESALAKAALVTRALWGCCPDLAALEKSIEDVIEAQAVGTVLGHSVQEILWEVRQDAAGGSAILPRAFRRLGSRHFGYTTGMAGQAGDALRFRPQSGHGYGNWEDFPEHQFVTGIYPGHEGHPSVAAPLRCLAKYWIAATYGPEWLLSYAQLFGQPFRWATYRPGDEKAKAAICAMLANIGAAGWAAFPEGTQMQLHEASKSAGDLPQKLIIDLANEAANILVLGQTLTSNTGSEGGGSYALGKVHTTVRREILSATAGRVAKVLTHTLSRAVVELNYGNTTEVPEIRAELADAKDEKAMAERDQILANMGLPLPLEWLHERHAVPLPTAGEAILSPAAPIPVNPATPIQPVTTIQAARAAGLPDSFLDALTEINTAILEDAAAQGWLESQISLNPTTPTAE